MTINIVIPFKPFPQGKTRLASNGINSEEIILLQKRLLQKNVQIVSEAIPSASIHILTTDRSLAEKYMPSSTMHRLVMSDRYPQETLGKQLEAFLQTKTWENAIVLVSDLSNLLARTIKAVYSLLSIYDGVVVPTADQGTGILGLRKKGFLHLDHFGKKSAERFVSKWEDENFLVAEFHQIPVLLDIDNLTDLNHAKEKGYL